MRRCEQREHRFKSGDLENGRESEKERERERERTVAHFVLETRQEHLTARVTMESFAL